MKYFLLFTSISDVNNIKIIYVKLLERQGLKIVKEKRLFPPIRFGLFLTVLNCKYIDHYTIYTSFWPVISSTLALKFWCKETSESCICYVWHLSKPAKHIYYKLLEDIIFIIWIPYYSWNVNYIPKKETS